MTRWAIPCAALAPAAAASRVWRTAAASHLTLIVKGEAELVPGESARLVKAAPVSATPVAGGPREATLGQPRADFTAAGTNEGALRIMLGRHGRVLIDARASSIAELGPLADSARLGGPELDAGEPLIPADWDWRRFQQAPAGQRADALWGDEWIAIEGANGRMWSQLPGMHATARLYGAPEGLPTEPIALRLEHVHLVVDTRRLVLFWRSHAPFEGDLSGAVMVGALARLGEVPAFPDDPSGLGASAVIATEDPVPSALRGTNAITASDLASIRAALARAEPFALAPAGTVTDAAVTKAIPATPFARATDAVAAFRATTPVDLAALQTTLASASPFPLASGAAASTDAPPGAPWSTAPTHAVERPQPLAATKSIGSDDLRAVGEALAEAEAKTRAKAQADIDAQATADREAAADKAAKETAAAEARREEERQRFADEQRRAREAEARKLTEARERRAAVSKQLQARFYAGLERDK